MKLRKLEISGFKSFVDKAVIDFPAGITAVVGPNGCGKSNVIDAIRWVMGEQSVKQLRGKSMEDVIFAGTNGKPPLGMAEVSLTLANDNGSAPEELRDFTEINVTRRLYRSGESAYLLNKQPCRLKDVHNLCLGSGLGSRSYSVIQQGNIGIITEAGPEERRVDDHLRDLLFDVGLAREPVRLGDQLREADELIGLLDERGQPAEPLPEPERVREHRRVARLAVEEDPLVRHEHVVEYHEALGRVMPARHREIALVLVTRCIRRVDDLHARRVHRNHAGH